MDLMNEEKRTFQVGCDLDYAVNGPGVFLMNVQVSRGQQRTILEESLTVSPEFPLESMEIGEAGMRLIRFSAEPGDLRIRYRATVEVHAMTVRPEGICEIPVGELPSATLRYLFASRYCQSDRLLRMAQHLFGSVQPGFERVTAICNWIFQNVEYLQGTTNVQTSAIDTVAERAGVCRDFAHLGIAFCRALNIPARFATGYAHQLMPQDFHAYFEAFLGGRWYAFDATRLAPQTGLIRIGSGVDATEASFATIFGQSQMTGMRVFAEMANGGGSFPDYVTSGVASL